MASNFKTMQTPDPRSDMPLTTHKTASQSQDYVGAGRPTDYSDANTALRNDPISLKPQPIQIPDPRSEIHQTTASAALHALKNPAHFEPRQGPRSHRILPQPSMMAATPIDNLKWNRSIDMMQEEARTWYNNNQAWLREHQLDGNQNNLKALFTQYIAHSPRTEREMFLALLAAQRSQKILKIKCPEIPFAPCLQLILKNLSSNHSRIPLEIGFAP